MPNPTTTITDRIKTEVLKPLEWIAVVLILIAAAFLRVGNTGVIEFKRDEATLSRLALDLATLESFPWLGIGSSIGFPNSPINVYIFSIPYIFSDNPLLATLFVGFLNMLAVALLWYLARRYVNKQAALVAAFLYAVSPWAALYSRKIWAQDILAPFILLTILTGLLGYIEGKKWARLWHLPLLAITVQIHFGALSLIPVSLLLLLHWRRLGLWFGLSVVVAALTCLPYLYGLYDADLLSLTALQESLDNAPEQENRNRELSRRAFDYAWFSVAGRDIHSLAGPEAFEDYLDDLPAFGYDFFSLLAFFCLVMIPYGLWRAIQGQYLWWVWLLWLVTPVLLFSYTWAAPQPHYMIPLLPVAFLVIGIGVSQLGERWPRLAYGLGGLLLVLGLMQMLFLNHLLQFLDQNRSVDGFGVPIHYELTVRRSILDQEPERVIVVSEGASPAFVQGPAVWDIYLNRVPQVDFLSAGHLWLIPKAPTLLLLTPAIAADDPWLMPITAPPSQRFPLRPDEGDYRLWFSLAFEDLPEGEAFQANYANGLRLLRWHYADEDLCLLWEVPVGVGTSQPIVFAHGINAVDERIFQRDLPFLAEQSWQKDDRVWWCAPWSMDGLALLRVGLYTLKGERGFYNIPYVDENGAYLDQWATIPLSDSD